jgi:hypothetical protein
MTGLRAGALVVALGTVLTGLLAGDAATIGVGPTGIGATDAGRPAWTEVRWPFLLDQWGTGRAFRCRVADCGAEISLYVRPMLGFCNCSTGVADDEELDRVGDVELFGPHFSPLAGGHSVGIGWMKGRSRLYRVDDPAGPREALAIGVNDKCDVVVATMAADRDLDAATAQQAENAALAFLNGETVLRWTKAELGL